MSDLDNIWMVQQKTLRDDAFETFRSREEGVNTHKSSHSQATSVHSITSFYALSIVSRLMLESRSPNTHAESGGRSTKRLTVSGAYEKYRV